MNTCFGIKDALHTRINQDPAFVKIEINYKKKSIKYQLKNVSCYEKDPCDCVFRNVNIPYS